MSLEVEEELELMITHIEALAVVAAELLLDG
jgi:hypothetical protein